MKKADLNAEHGKFVAFCMANRITSFNPDANFKIWCDRWLEHKHRTGNPPPRKADVGAAQPSAARAPSVSSMISPEAFEIAGALERVCGFNLPEELPPGWCGGAMWVQKCLNDGWVGEVMIDATKAVVKRKNGFIQSFKYLERPLAEAMAQHLAPLPQVEIRQPEKLTVTANGKQQSGSVIQAADRLLDKVRSFDALPSDGDGIRDGAGPTSPRLLSQG
jgi:hypothetical protein